MGWFSKKMEQPSPLNSDRYQGKPLLILLENYVLDCIGCIPEDKLPTITAIVQRVYGGGDDWKATLRSTLHLGDSLDENLRKMWVRNQDLARQANETLLPEDFARMVVDQNFSSIPDCGKVGQTELHRGERCIFVIDDERSPCAI